MYKQKFVKIINRLQSASDLQKNINKLMREAEDNICNDFMNAGALMINHEDIVIDLLGEIMCDSSKTISWWIYETDYGRKEERCTFYIGSDHDRPITIRTIEELYDFIVEYAKPKPTDEGSSYHQVKKEE